MSKLGAASDVAGIVLQSKFQLPDNTPVEHRVDRRESKSSADPLDLILQENT